MSTGFSKTDGYVPSAFYFKVVFSGASDADTSFKEVNGLSTELAVEEVEEGGENGFIHRLPKRAKNQNLVLKRGIAQIDSPLVDWCKTVLEGGLAEKIVPQGILVHLMNEDKTPIRSWSISNAYPVKWDVDGFESQKNEVAIETIELVYHGIQRIA